MKAVAALVIKNGEILIVQDKQQGWLFPGGKAEQSEGDLACLKREIPEELSGASFSNPRYYRTYHSQSTKHNRTVEVPCYFVDLSTSDVKPSSEISRAVFTSTPENYALIPTAREIIKDLRKEGFL